VKFWESQHDGCRRNFHRFFGNQTRTLLRKVSPEHAGYVEQRTATANQTPIMWAVTDHITFSAQHGILQRYRIENPSPFPGILDN